MNPDPTTEALVRDLLTQLDDQEDNAQLSYVDALRRVQGALTKALATAEPDLTSEQDAALSQTLGRLSPTADDARIDPVTRLRRVHGWVDMELSRWTSAIVQPRGPSGTTVVAEPQTLTVGE